MLIVAGRSSDTVSALDGSGNAGTSSDCSRGDHKHQDTARHTNANDPTSGEKSALAGTSGTPSGTNRFATNDDSRNTDARTPLSHSHAEADVTNLTIDLAAKEPSLPSKTGNANKYLQVNGTENGFQYGSGGTAAWGGITGTLSNQTDLQDALDAKSATGHNHSLTNLTEKSYNSLTDKPTIPSTFDDLTDGTTNKAYTSTEKTKLSGIATGAEVNVNADWNAGSGDAQILNKPTISGSNTGDNAANSSSLAITAFSGLLKITVDISAPGSPSIGDLWVDTN